MVVDGGGGRGMSDGVSMRSAREGSGSGFGFGCDCDCGFARMAREKKMLGR